MKYYVAFCPFSDDCGIGGKPLGSFRSEAEARGEVKWHLQQCTAHDVPEADAELASRIAALEEEEYEEKEQASSSGKGQDQAISSGKGKEQASSSGKGKQQASSSGKGQVQAISSGKGKQQRWNWQPQNWWRSEPYAQTSTQLVARSSSTTIESRMRLEQQAIRCEAAARQAARLARSAAIAFEEEAQTIKELVDDIRRSQ